MTTIIEKSYIWLPRIFGCHCKESRSFHIHGQRFPICARCTGELVGIVIGIPIYIFLQLSWYIYILLMIPLLFDGFIQLLTVYESTNRRRFISGLLFGYGLISLFFHTNMVVFRFGRAFLS